MWVVNPEYAAGPSGSAFASLDAVFALQGEQITRDRLSEVLRVRVGVRHYYVKRYRMAGKGLRRFFGRSRIEGEWRNLLYFRAWGLPVATVVGYGMERRGGLFLRGAMITEELPNTTDLAQMVSDKDPRLQDRRWVEHVSRQVALTAREMHKRRFAHNDLKWRNILVDNQPLSNIYLIDCPGGTFWWGPFLERRKIKDLACLDRLAKRQLSRTQRLRFFLTYSGQTRLRPQDRKRLLKVVWYYKGREIRKK